MIKQFVSIFDEKKRDLEQLFIKKHPEDYKEIIKNVVTILSKGEDYAEDSPDPNRIHQIDDGDYQGTLIFVIGATGYQPSVYWYVKVGYGSCSGCDTLEDIRGYSDDAPTEKQVENYMTLALHVMQGMKTMGIDYDDVV